MKTLKYDWDNIELKQHKVHVYLVLKCTGNEVKR